MNIADAPESLQQSVTGRTHGLLDADLQKHDAALRAAIQGRRLLVVGAAGTIGSSTIERIVPYRPAAIDALDLDENGLVELVRRLRNRDGGLGDIALRAELLDFGGPIAERFLAAQPRYDAVLNFAAVKHVRSEKDIFSLLHMLDTNVAKHRRFLDWLARYGHDEHYFAVSTDKAANPTSLMGASKRLMEDVIFHHGQCRTTTTTRFANVAFSNGSLLQSFLIRVARGQPVAVPRGTERYFVTIREAGEICLLTAFLGPTHHILFPALEPKRNLVPLADVATTVLQYLGRDPVFFESEAEAIAAAATSKTGRTWPVLLTPLDTSGEKPFEEFVGADEREIEIGFKALRGICATSPAADLHSVIERLMALIETPDAVADKEDLVTLLARVVPSLQHRETLRSLDQRL
jgi:FlaA1/EpsC-like NDP-sugar epimerase